MNKDSFPFRLAKTLSTGLGLGNIPWASGTWGSLGGVLLAFGACHLPLWVSAVALLLLYASGTWSIGCYHSGTTSHSKRGIDRSEIVIDEIIGQWIAALVLHPEFFHKLFDPQNTASVGVADWKLWGLSFILFRLFDILKPWPLSWIDRTSKNQTGWKAAQAVILDDIGAAILSAGFLFLAVKFVPV